MEGTTTEYDLNLLESGVGKKMTIETETGLVLGIPPRTYESMVWDSEKREENDCE